MEEAAGEADEGNDEQYLEGVDDVVSDLRGGYVQAEDEGDGEAGDCGASEDGIDADEDSRGDAPGQLFGSGSHTEEREDGKSDAAVDPVVANGLVVLSGVRVIGLARLHC